jgi:kinesin family protein 23
LSDPNLSGRLPDDTKITDVNRNVVYAIFISYVEIYNNYIYDLLETDARDIVTGKTKFVSSSPRFFLVIHPDMSSNQ